MRAATAPDQRSRTARLLVADERGLSHRSRIDFPSMLRDGDVVVANDAATIPASLAGTHVRTGAAIEVRLAGRSSLQSDDTRFIAIVFGAGDYRTPTERRALPPPMNEGDLLTIGPLHAQVIRVVIPPRLVNIQFMEPPGRVWEGLALHGRPIQYAYVPKPLAAWDTWTCIAARPVAFEPPSAGFILDWSMLHALRTRGVAFATLTHAAGISSTGDLELDRRLPFDEPYEIPEHTARLIARARRQGGRVIAIGTTVVRALEAAATGDGRVIAGPGIARNRIGCHTTLRVVDAIVTGMHEPGSSHYDLLRAFLPDAVLVRVTQETEANDYLAHEFGDSMFVVHRRSGGTGVQSLRLRRRCQDPVRDGEPAPLARRWRRTATR